MAETKFTPGPWCVPQGAPFSVWRGETQQIACTKTVGTHSYLDLADTAEAIGNARLIAAAPDMLAALKATLRTIASMGLDLEASAPQSINANSYSDELRRLRAVIAKATGGEQ